MLVIAMFVASVTVCKIITYELLKCTRFESLTLKMKVKDVDDLPILNVMVKITDIFYDCEYLANGSR